MRDRYRREKDLPQAKKWLEDYFLTRKLPISERLLYTTRLMDLIYDSFDKEQTVQQTPQNKNVPNMESLAKDLFAALCSPVLRRKEDDSIKLRERILNKPLFDRIISNDRFDAMKDLCENKELPSFDAVSGFCEAFAENLSTTDIPELHFLSTIEILQEHVEKTVQAICDIRKNRKPVSLKRLLFLYNRVYRKLSQIDRLTKKVQKAAACWMENMAPVIDDALQASLDRAAETHTIMQAWSDDSGEMRNTPMNKKLLEHTKNNAELLKIARILGRYREITADKRKNSFAYGRGEKYDLTEGNDVTHCLASELALLGTTETEILFMQRYEQKRLMQYRKRESVVKGRGDMIVLIDESSSTRSVAGWAKALALALLDITAKDQRKFALVHFASADRIKTDQFEPGQYGPEDVMKAAKQFFGGGTSFESPLKEALRLMENGYENADITIITDGVCSLPEDFTEEFRKKAAAYKSNVTGILLDKDEPCGKSLEPFCDTIYHSKDLTEDEIAVEILNSKTS